MLAINTATPTTAQIMPQRLWFPDPAKGISANRVEEFVNFLRYPRVRFRPIPIVLSVTRRDNDLHLGAS